MGGGPGAALLCSHAAGSSLASAWSKAAQVPSAACRCLHADLQRPCNARSVSQACCSCCALTAAWLIRCNRLMAGPGGIVPTTGPPAAKGSSSVRRWRCLSGPDPCTAAAALGHCSRAAGVPGSHFHILHRSCRLLAHAPQHALCTSVMAPTSSLRSVASHAVG